MQAVLLVVCCLAAVSADKVSYEGYQVIEVTATTQHGRDALMSLDELDYKLDFWSRDVESAHILVSPEQLSDLKGYLTRNGLEFRVIKDNVQRNIDEEETRLKGRPKVFNVDDFNTYTDIVYEMQNLTTRCRTDLGVACEVTSIGTTYEGRDLWVFRISKNGGNRMGVWLDATTHAREWLGTASLLKILTQLVDKYAIHAQSTYLVDTYDFYILPVLNPDGYEYSWTTDRYWRKNRSPNPGFDTCPGTDLNRNFETDWSIAGSSPDPCEITYHGAGPASEHETQHVQAEAVRLGTSLLTSVHIHTYGQLWLIPWGAYAADNITCKIATDDAEMMTVANAAANAVQNTFNTAWARGNSCLTIYPASGLTMDYFKAVGGVKYVTTPELRGDDFVVDKSFIQPSFEELYNGITTAITTIENQP